MTRAYASAVLSAPIGLVWKHLRDFGGVDTYLDTVELTGLEGAADQVGCVRTARHRGTGEVFREQLVALSDVEYTSSYRILNFPPVQNCLVTVRLLPVSSVNATFIEWFSDFDVITGDPAGLAEFLVHEVYERCFDGLARLVDQDGVA